MSVFVQWEKQMVRSANFITIQGLTPNKTYYIRVLAFTSVGDGPLSQDLQIIAKTGGRRTCLDSSSCKHRARGKDRKYTCDVFSPFSPDTTLQFHHNLQNSRVRPSLRPVSCCPGWPRPKVALTTRSQGMNWSTDEPTTQRR